MFRNLAQNPPPLALISQYLPIAHAAVRDGAAGGSPAELVMAHVGAVLDGYHAAIAWKGNAERISRPIGNRSPIRTLATREV